MIESYPHPSMTSVEVFGSLLLGTGGVNGYEGVRKRTTTKKGEKVVEYQGYTPTKHNTRNWNPRRRISGTWQWPVLARVRVWARIRVRVMDLGWASW